MVPRLSVAYLILPLLSSLSTALPQSGFSRRNETIIRVVNATDATAAIPAFNSYTAIGDSYSSGPGPGADIEGDLQSYALSRGSGVLTQGCWRTKDSYPFLFRTNSINPASFQFLSCNGAKTNEIKAQTLLNVGLTIGTSFLNFGTPDLVTVSAGGNDGDLLRNIGISCFFGISVPGLNIGTCTQELDRGALTIQNIGPTLTDLYKTAATKNLANPNSKRTVAVTGYAKFFGSKIQNCREPNLPTLRPDCRNPGQPCQRSNDLVDALNRQIQTSITAAQQSLRSTNPNVKLVFVDIEPGFEGRRICDVLGTSQDAAFQVPTVLMFLGAAPRNQIGSPFHPSRVGYRAMANSLATVLGRT